MQAIATARGTSYKGFMLTGNYYADNIISGSSIVLQMRETRTPEKSLQSMAASPKKVIRATRAA